jgi:two-component system NtrC family response regulator
MVVVNCAALPESLIESELFGAKRGAYTGATSDRAGRFEEADGGTLFIDEVGEIPLSTQVKLLRAIQNREFQPVGSNESKRLSARIVAATNRNLEEMVEAGEFREDLFYRLRVIYVKLPPLRERKADIPSLINSFIERFASDNNKEIAAVSRDAREALIRHDYPGNIRELENAIEHAVVLSRGPIINLSDLPEHLRKQSGSSAPEQGRLDRELETLERRLIREALTEAQGNQSRAARLLGVSERRLRSRLERLGMK